MNIEEVQKFCETLIHVTQNIKWDDHLCFNVGEKMFLVTAPDSFPVSASFKVKNDSFNQLCEREGFIPAPYLARYKWVYLDDINRLSKSEFEQYILESYDLVVSKLPAKVKKSIGL